MTVNLELWSVAATVVSTLVGKWAWDRWLSQSSRVTKSECIVKQKLCSEALLSSISIQTNKLNEGTECFDDIEKHQERTDSKLMVILLTLLKICSHAGIDCDDLTREMVNREILK